VLGIGYWVSGTGHWILDAGYWMFDFGPLTLKVDEFLKSHILDFYSLQPIEIKSPEI